MHDKLSLTIDVNAIQAGDTDPTVAAAGGIDWRARSTASVWQHLSNPPVAGVTLRMGGVVNRMSSASCWLLQAGVANVPKGWNKIQM
jgi:hypothetical protein